MRPHSATITLVAADADGITTSQSGVANTPLSINGALTTGGVATLDPPQHVGITSSADDSAITFSIDGTDRFGNALTEIVTGGNATLASGSENFKTVTAVTPSGNTTGTVTVGTVAAAETAWWPTPRYDTPVAVGLAGVVKSGSPTYGVQFTHSNVQASGFQEGDATAFNHATFTGKTANFADANNGPVRALRITVSGAGAVEYTYTPAGR